MKSLICYFLLFLSLAPLQAQFAITTVTRTPFKNSSGGESNGRVQADAPAVCSGTRRNQLHSVQTSFTRDKKKTMGVSQIMYSQSPDSGKTWKTPLRISYYRGDDANGDSTVKGPMPAVGPDSTLYVIWSGPRGLAFQRSCDHGKSWLKEERMIAPFVKGWKYEVGGVTADGLASIGVDHGTGEFRGRIYVCWSDEKYGIRNKDVFVVYSDDLGENWTEPILLTFRPNHKEQFKPSLLVDSFTGYVYVLYYDRQNVPEGNYTDVYLAQSRNGGLKFDSYKLNDKVIPFTKQMVFETALEQAADGHLRAYWSRENEGRLQVCAASVTAQDLETHNQANSWPDVEMERVYSFAEKINIDFTLHNEETISAVLTKPLEPDFEKTVVKSRKFNKGANTLVLDAPLLGLPRGNYVLTLYYNGKNTFTWITE